MADFKSTEFYTGLYRDGTLTDYIMSCDGKDYDVHRFMLAMRSQFFEKKFDNKNKTLQGSDAPRMDMSGDDPAAVSIMIPFLYSLRYDDADAVGKFASPLDMHAALYLLGDKYDVPLLQDFAHDKFAQALVEAVCQGHSPFPALQLIFTTKPIADPIHSTIVKLWQLFGRTSVEQQPPKALEEFLVSTPEFAAVMVKSLAGNTTDFEVELSCTLEQSNSSVVSAVADFGVDRTTKCKHCKKSMLLHDVSITPWLTFDRSDNQPSITDQEIRKMFDQVQSLFFAFGQSATTDQAQERLSQLRVSIHRIMRQHKSAISQCMEDQRQARREVQLREARFQEEHLQAARLQEDQFLEAHLQQQRERIQRQQAREDQIASQLESAQAGPSESAS